MGNNDSGTPDADTPLRASNRSIHEAKHLLAVQALNSPKYRRAFCGNRRRTFRHVIAETSTVSTYQTRLVDLLRVNGLLKRNLAEHFSFNEEDGVSEVRFSQEAKARTIEDAAKQAYHAVSKWTCVHGGISDPVAIGRRREKQNIVLQTQLIKQRYAEQTRILDSPHISMSGRLEDPAKQKQWLKYITIALGQRSGKATQKVDDSMICSYFGQCVGLPMSFTNEQQSAGNWTLECKISDVLRAEATAQTKKKAKREAARKLLKVILDRHENSDTKFI